MFLTSVLLLSPALGGGNYAADVVELRDGGELRGRVLVHNYDGVVLRQGSREREIPAEEIRTVDALESRLATVLEHLLVVRDDDVRALTDLARVCEARGLEAEAGILFHRVLTLDPDHERASEALGHRQRGEGRVVQHNGTWLRWDDRVARSGDWNDAWELETSHYRLRTNLLLEDALDAAIDLERFYLFYYELFGSELGIHHVTDKMEAHLHADPASFPAIGHGRRAYYDPAARRLVVDASGDIVRPKMLHEATHQLLEVSGAHRRSQQIPVPAWLSEGLAEYAALSAQGPPGRAWFRAGSVASMHAYEHSRAAEPVGLTRLLALGSGDFLSAKDAALYYAQSWTLVHLCMNDADDRYREAFFRYLLDVYAGKGTPAGFKELVASDEGFEAEWHAHARRLAAGRR